MTAAVFDDDGPWTEEEYLARGETQQRVELFDGSLHVTPAPTPRHQRIQRNLGNILEVAAREVGLELLEGVNVRLKPGRIPIPDLVVTEAIDFDRPVIEADDVRLVCEVISPSNAATDKVLRCTTTPRPTSSGTCWSSRRPARCTSTGGTAGTTARSR